MNCQHYACNIDLSSRKIWWLSGANFYCPNICSLPKKVCHEHNSLACTHPKCSIWFVQRAIIVTIQELRIIRMACTRPVICTAQVEIVKIYHIALICWLLCRSLNIFNSRLVLASSATASDGDYARIEGVIGHEYFHNWTGNRVTCRDWFQLTLKEGLTVFRDQVNTWIQMKTTLLCNSISKGADDINFHSYLQICILKLEFRVCDKSSYPICFIWYLTKVGDDIALFNMHPYCLAHSY